MPGLVWVDSLALTITQQIGIALSMGLLFSGRLSRGKIGLAQAVILVSFWNTPLSTDTRLLFQSAASLQRFTWAEFLSEFAFRDYVKLQPPFYTFYVSRMPVLPGHQLIMSVWAVCCGCLMLELYGDKARMLLSTPVYLLMSSQPSNDLVLFGLLLISLRCLQLGYRGTAALALSLSYPVKPLVLVVFPFMAWRLKWRAVGSLTLWGLYILWSLQYSFGVRQADFLLHQLLVR